MTTVTIDYSGPCPSCSRPDAVRADGSIPDHDVYGLAAPCDAGPSLLTSAVAGAAHASPTE